jgi:hypothetical protein
VADEKLASLNAPRVVSQADERWMSTNEVESAVWTNLMDMKQGELRVIPGENANLVIRRGAFRGSRQLTYDEVRPLIRNDLMQKKEEAAWNEYVQGRLKELSLQPLAGPPTP